MTTAPRLESAHDHQSAPVPGPGLRLTRRGRIILLALLVGLTFAAFSLGRVSGNADPGKTSGAASTSAPATYAKVVVQPGDTLWSIARAARPGSDPRGYVQRIIDLNGLPGADVRIGQAISLP